MTPSPEIARAARSQSCASRSDFPSRVIAIATAGALASRYLDPAALVVILSIFAAIEAIGLGVYKRIETEVTWPLLAGLSGSALIGSCAFATIPVLLARTGDDSATVLGASILVITIIRCIVVRSRWMFFSAVSTAPMIAAIAYMAASHVARQDSGIDVAIVATMALLGCCYIVHSILTMNALNTEMSNAATAADAANRAKSRFLAAMSHEIRTPLNAICAMSEMIDEGDADHATMRERTHLLRKSAMTLTGIVDDILDHARIESGAFALRPAPAVPAIEIESAVAMFAGSAREKNLDLDLHLDPDLPGHARFDAQRLRQVIANLVSNAVKYTESGKITVTAGARPESGATHLCVRVSDTGRGMTEAQREKLFAEFYRVEDGGARSAPGTGLGLSIARRFARMMGGDISVTTTAGEGSCFAFDCRIEVLTDRAPDPVSEPSGAASPGVPPADATDPTGTASGTASGARTLAEETGFANLLVVDDNEANRLVAKALLKNQGLTLHEAGNGEEALSIMEGAGIDIVLLDIRMPVMDGRETLRRMRQSGSRFAGIPVIMLSANASPEDREVHLGLGAAGHISKPVSKASLLGEVRSAARGG